MTTRDKLLAEAGRCTEGARVKRTASSTFAAGAVCIGRVASTIAAQVHEATQEVAKLDAATRKLVAEMVEQLLVAHARNFDQQAAIARGEADALAEQAKRLAKLVEPDKPKAKARNAKARTTTRKGQATKRRARGRS